MTSLSMIQQNLVIERFVPPASQAAALQSVAVPAASSRIPDWLQQVKGALSAPRLYAVGLKLAGTKAYMDMDICHTESYRQYHS